MKPQRKVILFSASMLLVTNLISQQRIDLLEAIDQGLVTAEFLSTGSSSQDCVDVTVNNVSKRDLVLTVNTGFQLATLEQGDQDILITKEEEIIADAGESTSERLYGFCAQALNAVPTSGSGFVPNGYAQNDMAKLAVYLNDHKLEPELEQEAVWTMVEGLPIAGIYSDASQEDKDLRAFCADLRGEEAPTYNIDYGDVLDTQFSNEVVELNGEMNYRITENSTASLRLVAPDGSEMVSYFEDRPLSPANYTQRFTFSGHGLQKGEYKFVLLIDGEEFREMTIEV
ncbi:MAG: hypothetical protein MK081_15095 [Flavobacteriales bacterium]|nr:hypothetical protein [Flavobacteriales bacterium]